MGMFGPDVFDIINKTTNHMKLEKTNRMRIDATSIMVT